MCRCVYLLRFIFTIYFLLTFVLIGTKTPKAKNKDTIKIHFKIHLFKVCVITNSVFTWLFPTGMFGFSHERDQHFSLSMYLKNRLYNYRGNFRKNLKYVVHSAVEVDLSHLKLEI